MPTSNDHLREWLLREAKTRVLQPHELMYLLDPPRRPIIPIAFIHAAAILLGIVFVWGFVYANIR